MLTYNDWQKLNEKKDQVYEFGCSMLYFNSNAIPEIQQGLNEDDIYTEDNGKSYGLENEHHVTLLYGIHSDVDEADVMRISADNIPAITLDAVSVFENTKYDVLKIDAFGDKLHEINARLRKLPHTSSFPDYHPHATIAYLKPGCGKKYAKQFAGINETVTPTHTVYSKADGTKTKHPLNQ